MNICVLGGGGYVGSALVPHLLSKGHHVTVLDTFWYGDHLPKSSTLRRIKADIRDRVSLRNAFHKQDAVIHLACISNDPSFELNPRLGKDINLTSFKEVLSVLSQENVARFIYASSSSVYGVSDAPEVFEDTKKAPLTDYSKYKLGCENWLKSFGTGGIWTIVRPATICGYAPRMRLDVVVNILTIQALLTKKITLFGMKQMRPNLNIRDMVLAYDFLLNKPPKYIDQKVFNVGFENMTLYQIAMLIKATLKDKEISIVEQPTLDPRSYHINSDKIKGLGFAPSHSIYQAILSIKHAVEEKLLFEPLNNPEYYNIKRMKELKIV